MLLDLEHNDLASKWIKPAEAEVLKSQAEQAAVIRSNQAGTGRFREGHYLALQADQPILGNPAVHESCCLTFSIGRTSLATSPLIPVDTSKTTFWPITSSHVPRYCPRGM